MKSVNFLLVIMAFILVGCSSNDITNYPRYSERVAKMMENKDMNASSGIVASDVPDLSKLPDFMAPGHLFSISHSSDNKLSGRFRADFNGVLRLPYNVTINVKNKSFTEVRETVLNSYRKFFQRGVEAVTFTLQSKDYWVEVRGLVKKPGRYLVRDSDSLDLVVDAAGGVSGDISSEYYSASLKQDKYEYQVLLNRYFESSEDVEKIKWLGGDNVFISKLDSKSGTSGEVPFVSIIGGVTKPGKILHEKDASLFYYLEKSGGLIQGLAYDECYVYRNTKDGVKKIQFSFDKPETIPVIYANDTVYMNTRVQTAADTLLTRISQIAGMISAIAVLIIAL